MTDKLQQEAIARWMPSEGTLLGRSAIGWFVRYEDYLVAAAVREKELVAKDFEIERISKLLVATVTDADKEIASLRAKLGAVPVGSIRAILDDLPPFNTDADALEDWLATVTK